MSITITCPKCQSSYTLKDSVRGRRVRCPTEGCNRVLIVPDAGAPPESVRGMAAPASAPSAEADGTDTFRLASPANSDEVPPTPIKRRPKKRDFEPVPTTRSADQEVLLPDGRIRPMTMRDIRDALIAGKITRFSPMRSIDDEDGAVANAARSERAWQPIGFRVFIAPEKERPHYSKAARQGMSYRDDVALISGIGLFVLVMLGVGVLLYRLNWDFSGEQVALAAAFAVGYFALISAQSHRLTVTLVLAGATYVIVRNVPDMSVAMAKSGIFVCVGLIAVPFVKALGFLGGIAFDYAYRAAHYDPNDTGPQKRLRDQAPYDGYPWMFWRAWDQRRLLRKTLIARSSKSTTRND